MLNADYPKTERYDIITVMENSYQFFENRACQYFPCHKGLSDFNCLFCYCPLYQREDCPGNPLWLKREGRRIKDCTNCTFPHRPENYDKVIGILRGRQTKEPEV